MHVSAKADYALRAMVELASAEQLPLKGEQIAKAQDIPLKFLENILLQLKHTGIVHAQRGAHGGYWLGRPPEEITLADIFRAVEGPLVRVHGLRPEDVAYSGTAVPLRDIWIAVRVSLRTVLESVTLADLQGGNLPQEILDLTLRPEAWTRR